MEQFGKYQGEVLSIGREASLNLSIHFIKEKKHRRRRAKRNV
jgi:hypothetical protein